MDLNTLIRDIPDFPKEGIIFKDITPLLADPAGFHQAIDDVAALFADSGATKVVAIEARGFIVGAPVAYKLGLGFIPVRKPGKLPYKTIEVSYELEYGSDTICMHEDALTSEDRVLVIDDLLATGGTVGASVKLIEKTGATIVGIGFLMELDFLHGRATVGDHTVHSLMHVNGD